MKKFLTLLTILLTMSALAASQNYGGELDGDWGSVEDEKEYRLGFFADRSKAEVKALDDGSIQVTNTETGSSIEVKPGEMGDASDIFGGSITDNFFANCGRIYEDHDGFNAGEVNFYYEEDGGGNTRIIERTMREELGDCFEKIAESTEKDIGSEKGRLYLKEGKEYELDFQSTNIELEIKQMGATRETYFNIQQGSNTFRARTGDTLRLKDDVFIEVGERTRDSGAVSYSTKVLKADFFRETDYSFDKWQKDFSTRYAQLLFSIHGRGSDSITTRGDVRVSTEEENYHVGLNEDQQITLDGESVKQLSSYSCEEGREVLERFDGYSLVMIGKDCTSGSLGRQNQLMMVLLPQSNEDSAVLPDASVSEVEDTIDADQEVEIDVEVNTDGLYHLSIEGAGINREENIEASGSFDINPESEGQINIELSVDDEDWSLLDGSKLLDEQEITVADALPDASISYDFPSRTNSFTEGDQTSVTFEFNQPGEYKISTEINGETLIDEEIDAETGQTYSESLSLSEEGTLRSEVIAPGSLWIFGSDKTVGSNSVDVEAAENVIDAESGQVHNISVRQGNDVVNYEGRSFRAQNTYRVASDSNPPTGVRFVWSDGETTTLSPNEQSSGIYLCEFGRISEGDYALVAVGDEENSGQLCREESDNLEDQYSADFGEVVNLQRDEVAEFEGYEAALNGVWATGITVDGMSHTNLKPKPRTSSDNYIIPCRANPDTDNAEFTIVQERQNPYEVCNVDVDEKRNDPSKEYQIKNYQLGEIIMLSEGEGIEFGGSKAFIDEINRIDSNYVRVRGYKEWADKPVHDFHVPSEDGSTVEWFAEGRIVIGTCRSTEEEVEIVMRDAETDIPESAEWPEDWCEGEPPVQDSGSEEESESSDASSNEQGSEDSGDSETRLEIVSEQAVVGEDIDLVVSVPEKIAESGYLIDVGGPEEYSETFNSESAEYSFNPGEAGEYVVEVRPQEGLLGSIMSSITGEESLKQESISVSLPDQPRWRDYCIEQDYGAENVNQRVNCIQEEIVPRYFEGSMGEDPEVADSLCRDLLGLEYNENAQRCE